MAKEVQIRRGTATEHDSFAGAFGEITYETTNYKIVLHDGSTTGGVNETLMASDLATNGGSLAEDASELSYDNTTSGLTATDVQAAVDEVEGRVDSVESASGVAYDPSTSPYTGTTVQAALDESGTAALVDTGTAPEDIPLNSDASGLTWPDESTAQEWQLTIIDGDLVIREVV